MRSAHPSLPGDPQGRPAWATTARARLTREVQRRGSHAAWAALDHVACVLEQMLSSSSGEVSVIVARSSAPSTRAGDHVSAVRERTQGRASSIPRDPRLSRVAPALAVRPRGLRLRSNGSSPRWATWACCAVELFMHARRRAGGQRARPAPAQQRPLDSIDAQRDEPVRAAGACRARRSGARRPDASTRRGDSDDQRPRRRLEPPAPGDAAGLGARCSAHRRCAPKLHLYGKATKPDVGRKMGHITVLGATRDEALASAAAVRAALAR